LTKILPTNININNLVAYFKFNDSSSLGLDSNPSSTKYNLTPTIVGGTGGYNSTVAIEGASFQATNDGDRLEGDFPLKSLYDSSTTGISISCWFYKKSASYDNIYNTHLFHFHNPSDSSQWINMSLAHYNNIYTTNFSFSYTSGETYSSGFGPTQAFDTWYHVVLILTKSGNIKVYLNGTNLNLVSGTTNGTIRWYNSSVYPLPQCPNTTKLKIFTTVGLGAFSGNIDEFYVFNKELTQTEVTSLYNKNYSTTSNIRLGAGTNEGAPTLFFANGSKLDDFRFYNKELTAAEISNIYNLKIFSGGGAILPNQSLITKTGGEYTTNAVANTGSGGGGYSLGSSGVVIMKYKLKDSKKKQISNIQNSNTIHPISIPAITPVAVTNSSTDYYQSFTNTTNYTVTFNQDVQCEVIIIGGGGSGACRHGGGGGAGSYINTTYTFAAGKYTFKVGTGGTGQAAGTTSVNGNNGTDSFIINSNNTDILRAKGGGGGSYYLDRGLAGGSSGGSGGSTTAVTNPLTSNVPFGTYGNRGGCGALSFGQIGS
jgi:hypothetical protein